MVVGSVQIPGRYPYYPGFRARDYVSLAGGESELGRSSGWRLFLPDGEVTGAHDRSEVAPGSTIQVPEKRSRSLMNILGPLTTAVALALSAIALANQSQ